MKFIKHSNIVDYLILAFFILILDSSYLKFCSAKGETRSQRLSRRSLEAEVINSTTIHLSWVQDPDQNSKVDDGESAQCPVQQYLIKLKESSVGKVKTWKVEAGKESVTLHGLRPSTDYFIRVVTVGCDGRGKPSRWVRVRTSKESSSYHINDLESLVETTAPGRPVGLVTVAMSNSAVVSWKPPDGAVLVRGYVVGYGEGVPDVNWQYLEAHRRNVTIRNLKKSTQYVISLRAFNNQGKGPVVYDLVFTKDSKDDPIESAQVPVNLQSRILSPTTIWLQWTDPSLDKHQTITDNRYYSVTYRSLPDGRNMTVVVRDLHVALYHLEPATRYEFRVRIVQNSKPGQYSEPIVNRTIETEPSSPPRQVKIELTSGQPSRIFVSWKPPRHANGNITEYIILYTWIEEWLTEPDRWQSLSVPGHSNEATLSNTNLSVTYYFRLQARNSHGYGPKTDILKIDTRDGVATAESVDDDVTTDSKSTSRLDSSVKTRDPDSNEDSELKPSPDNADQVDVDEDPGFEELIRPNSLAGLDASGKEQVSKIKRERNPDFKSERRDLISSAIVHPNEEDSTSYQEFLSRGRSRSPDKDGGQLQDQSKSPPSIERTKSGNNFGSDKKESNINILPTSNSRQNGENKTEISTGTIQVHFTSMVKIRASAYITWPRYPHVTSCAQDGGSSDVISYKLRYKLIDDKLSSNAKEENDFVTINLTENIFVLDNLQFGAKYKYQVKYIVGLNMEEGAWSQPAILNIL